MKKFNQLVNFASLLLVIASSTIIIGLIHVYSANTYHQQNQHTANHHAHPFMMGMGHYGMMDNFTGIVEDENLTRLSIEEVKEIVEEYASSLGNNFGVMEIMEFSRNFYAVIYELDTNKGAFQILIHPYTGVVMREPGPSMMWNLKYGMMRRSSILGAEMRISLDEAKHIAERYLNRVFPRQEIKVVMPMTFYGYYNFDYELNGKKHGMLSVNGYSGAVWYHWWHGKFIQEIHFSEVHGEGLHG